jgi:hypothetical protein
MEHFGPSFVPTTFPDPGIVKNAPEDAPKSQHLLLESSCLLIEYFGRSFVPATFPNPGIVENAP